MYFCIQIFGFDVKVNSFAICNFTIFQNFQDGRQNGWKNDKIVIFTVFFVLFGL